MANNKALIAVALAGLMGSGMAIAGDKNAPKANPKMENCYGLAHPGQSKVDMNPDNITKVPAGTCEKMGGKLKLEKPK